MRGRSRLVRQMLTESLLIALVGGALRPRYSPWAGCEALVSLLPADFPRVDSIHVNAAVLAFTLLVALAAGFALRLGARLGGRPRLNRSRACARAAAVRRYAAAHLRLRNVLVVAEVGLASVLLIGAGLMLRSFVNLLRMDPGFRPEHVLTARSHPAFHRIQNTCRCARVLGPAHHQSRLVSGVKYAGVGTDLPWTGYDENTAASRSKERSRRPGRRISRPVSRRDTGLLSRPRHTAGAGPLLHQGRQSRARRR